MEVWAGVSVSNEGHVSCARGAGHVPLAYPYSPRMDSMSEDERPHDYKGIEEDPPQWADETGNSDPIYHVPEEPLAPYNGPGRRATDDGALIIPPLPPDPEPAQWPERERFWEPDYTDQYVPTDERERIPPVGANPAQQLNAVLVGLRSDHTRAAGELPAQDRAIDIIINQHLSRVTMLKQDMQRINATLSQQSAARANARIQATIQKIEVTIGHLRAAKVSAGDAVGMLLQSANGIAQSIAKLNSL